MAGSKGQQSGLRAGRACGQGVGLNGLRMVVVPNLIRLISTKGLRSLEKARMVEGGTGPNRSHPRRLAKIVLA